MVVLWIAGGIVLLLAAGWIGYTLRDVQIKLAAVELLGCGGGCFESRPQVCDPDQCRVVRAWAEKCGVKPRTPEGEPRATVFDLARDYDLKIEEIHERSAAPSTRSECNPNGDG